MTLPFQPASLMFVALTTLCIALVTGLPGGIPYLPYLAMYIVGSWSNKYAFALLDHAANGRREAPVASVEMLGPFGDARAWVHPALAAVLAFAAWRLGAPWGVALGAAGALLLPASVAAVAMSGHLADALHPRALWEALRGLGPWYLVLLGAAAVLVAGGAWLVAHAPFALALRFALLQLGVFCFAALIGTLLHRRRNQLGFEPVISPERTAARVDEDSARRRQHALDEFHVAVRARQRLQAVRAVDGWLTTQPQGARLAGEVEAIIAQVAAWPEARGLATLLRTVISHGVRTGQGALALQAAETGLARVAGFTVEDADELLVLARQARLSGRRRLAAQLIDNHVTLTGGRPLPEVLAALRAELG